MTETTLTKVSSELDAAAVRTAVERVVSKLRGAGHPDEPHLDDYAMGCRRGRYEAADAIEKALTPRAPRTERRSSVTTKRMWAATWTHWGDDFMNHSVRSRRSEVIDLIGEMWRRFDYETPRQGWARAYRKGIRAVRVDVTRPDHEAEREGEG